jgi:hypothetical protein
MLKPRVRRIERRTQALLKRLQEIANRGPPPPSRRVQTAQDIIDLLQEQVEALRADTSLGTVEKARAVAYLAGVARKAIETGTLAARLELMEQVLKQRSKIKS